jgi:hypothetical protein
LDGHVYVPITSSVELIGLVGVSWLTARAHVTGPSFGSIVDKKAEWGRRAGGGLEFGLNDSVSLRSLVL